MPKRHFMLVMAFIASTPQAALAGTSSARHQSHAAITRAVYSYLEHALEGQPGRHEIIVSRIDPRLRLPRCGAPLQVEPTSAGTPLGRLTLRVRCEGSSKPWRIHVGARVARYLKVLVSGGFLERRHALEQGDFLSEEWDVSALPRGYFVQPERLVGLIVKRPVPAGRVISPDMVRPPLLVRRGETVTIVAKHGGIAVRMSGKALADGALGATVRARNERSHRIVEGRVSAGREITVSSREG